MIDSPPEGKPLFGRRYRFPFDKIDIGKGFIVLGMNRNTMGAYKAYAEKHSEKRFQTRKVQNGVAVWRIK